MLKLAFPYKDKLDAEWQKIIFEPKYKFYCCGSYWKYKIDVSDNSWDKFQFVSMDKSSNVIGYFSAYIDRTTNVATGIEAINFGSVNMIFSKDFYQFLTELFVKHDFRKIEWRVVVGNPAEKMYDKIVERYGGRIIGTRRESAKTDDGILRDEKDYEILRRDYENHKTQRG